MSSPGCERRRSGQYSMSPERPLPEPRQLGPAELGVAWTRAGHAAHRGRVERAGDQLATRLHVGVNDPGGG